MSDLDLMALLGRQPIQVDADGSYITGHRVMVTGAGGSIGSVICRHVAQLNPSELIMMDRDETALHALQLAMTGRSLFDDSSMVLGDVRDRLMIYKMMVERRPHVVFHAAALKHQTLLEQYPREAFKTNVLGTRNVMQAAASAGAKVLVNISTDKAASHRCVLGTSKRLGERLVSWCDQHRFISVRFGNVIGSRGSVLDTFMAQLAADTPLTVTDECVSRYFMTADEAVSLVIHAGAIGRLGEVLVLDMGEPVHIVDIAERLIAMTGNGRGKIIYTGLRSGEQNQEVRLGSGECDNRPYHPLISQVPVAPLQPSLLREISDNTNGDIRQKLIELCQK